ncbi:MAG TPA: (Fe-S)-binding protein [Nitrosospira sp.]
MAQDEKIQGSKIAEGLTRRQLIEMHACARCGECQVWCPVYAQDSRELITARGKLGFLRRLIEGTLSGDDRKDFINALYECSACGQCHVVCPVRINTHDLWEQARMSLVKSGIPQPEGQIKQLSAIKEFNNPFGKPQSERSRWADMAWKAGLLKARVPLWKEQRTPVVYFAGCMASFDSGLQPVAVQSARLLQEAGVEFSILGEDEPCCMSKLRRMGDSGFMREARKIAEMFDRMDISSIVVSCAGCFKGLYGDYSTMWPGSKKVLHFSQYLDYLIQEGRLRPQRETRLRVTYHDPCHLGRHNQVYDQPRRVLQSVPGITLVEMPRHRAFSSCCGMGGGLKAVNPEIQHKMAAARVREAEATGAEAIVTPCQTCLQGLLNGKKEAASTMKVFHLNEVLARSICPEVTHEVVEAELARRFAGV